MIGDDLPGYEWESYVRVDLRDEILRLARDLIRQHPLRGFDAIHLASALSVKRAVGEDLTFGAVDVRLLRAAESEGLTSINVEAA
jgi:hypothetical protein